MQTKIQKMSLLADMIAFAIVDGKLHDKEFKLLSMIADELKISTKDFKELFHQELHSDVIKSDFERIQQFYRLALLMHSDGILHERELVKIHEIGLTMGLNPFAIKRILKAMEQSPTRTISPTFLLHVFQEQLN
ncbi:MAG: excinuclease ABC subunit B [Flavobacterium sp.]|nr:excinuclease ABC subunit B [Flavobacterium sp.]